MTLPQRLLAVVVALALFGAPISTSQGKSVDSVDTSSVTIFPGPLTASFTWASFDVPADEVSVQTLDGYLVLRVLDERGSVTGWTVSVSTMDYSGPGGHLGADQLALSPGPVTTVRGNPDLAGHATVDIGSLRTSPARVWSVQYHAGDGEYDLALAGTLGMPVNQPGTHVYTLIVSIDGLAP